MRPGCLCRASTRSATGDDEPRAVQPGEWAGEAVALSPCGLRSFAGLAGGMQRVRSGYAAVFPTASDDQQSQPSDLRFIARSTQFEVVNAQIVSFASSRSGVRFPLAPQVSRRS